MRQHQHFVARQITLHRRFYAAKTTVSFEYLSEVQMGSLNSIQISITVGFSVDWWALGVLLYEMLAGRSPFDIAGASENPDQVNQDCLSPFRNTNIYLCCKYICLINFPFFGCGWFVEYRRLSIPSDFGENNSYSTFVECQGSHRIESIPREETSRSFGLHQTRRFLGYHQPSILQKHRLGIGKLNCDQLAPSKNFH